MKWIIAMTASLVLCSCEHHPEHDHDAGGKKHSEREHDAKRFASELDVAKIADSKPYKNASVEVLESAPVQFVLVLSRDLPLAGYDAKVESVGKPDGKGQIVVKLREIPPTDAGLTMIDTKQYRLELGSLAVGKYVIEMHVRSSKDGAHELVQSLAVEAK